MVAPFSIVVVRMVASGSSPRAWKFITPATPLPERREKFPRGARLRRTSEFQAVRSRGRMVQGRWLRLSLLREAVPGDDSPARLGVVTSRRVGPAVKRNRVRRRVRELFRKMRARLPAGSWIVVTAKPGAGDASFDELREEWLRLAERLSILRTSDS